MGLRAEWVGKVEWQSVGCWGGASEYRSGACGTAGGVAECRSVGRRLGRGLSWSAGLRAWLESARQGGVWGAWVKCGSECGLVWQSEGMAKGVWQSAKKRLKIWG